MARSGADGQVKFLLIDERLANIRSPTNRFLHVVKDRDIEVLFDKTFAEYRQLLILLNLWGGNECNFVVMGPCLGFNALDKFEDATRSLISFPRVESKEAQTFRHKALAQ